MCGIVGVIGKNAPQKVVEILKRLEYRGYDSCGIACLIDGKLRVVKTIGSPINLKIPEDIKNSEIAIGHTRWATHGRVSLKNTQPVTYGNFATVHNGMITNHKEFLDTELDSVVIPYLFHRGLDVDDVMKLLRGAFTSITLTPNGSLVGIKAGTPLVIGSSKDYIIFSSDYQSILDMVDEFAVIPDNSYVIASKYGITAPVELNWQKVNVKEVYYKIEDAPPGYYTHKEILEQSHCLTNCLENKDKIQEFSDCLKKFDRILFVGSGSSYHACLYGKLLLLGKVCCVQAIPASEFITDRLIGKTAIVGVSQSGETADLLYVINQVQSKCKIFSITNNPYSSLAQVSEVFLHQNVGTEYSVIATKTFTSQLVLLYLISKAWDGKLDEGIKGVVHLQHILNTLLHDDKLHNTLKQLTSKLADKQHIYILGRGLGYVTALEVALKLKEVCYIHAEALPSGELKHGPLALIEEGTPVLAFVDSSDERTLLNLAQVKSRGGFVVGISPVNSDYFDVWIRTPELGELNPIIQVVVGQLLSYYLAKHRGLNPDRPRNLAKTVTVL